MESFVALRRMMVDCQLRTYDVTDRSVLAAADIVPREAFLPAGLSHLAYLDQTVALPGTGRAPGDPDGGRADDPGAGPAAGRKPSSNMVAAAATVQH